MAKLQEVIIQGYKSIAFDRPVTLKLNDVSILLGANGAGKSNIISFFQMLSYMMSKSFGKYVEISGTSNALLHYGTKKTPIISGEIKFSDDQSIDRYSFSLTNANPDRLIITDEKISWHRNGENKPYEINLEPEYKESALAESTNPTAKIIFQMLSSCKVYQFHDSSAEGPLRQVCPVETTNYLQSHGNNLPSFLLFLRDNYKNSYNRIIDYVRDVVPQFQDFYLEPNNRFISLRWMDNSATDYRFNAYQFSDGSIRFIALATLLLQPPQTMPNVIILDEPELGLHPYAITQLAEMIKDASIHAQIIIATQSKDLVDHFDIDNISVVEMDKETQSTSVTHLSNEEYNLWLQKYTVSELWDKNIIGGRPV
ncbi:MAG: AAA family ATPase [Bacteroidales bacterium]|nr:AAA family ATPase [Bacteroidales bacterium]MEE1225893.1 AAA family ATPase [Bacteroidales bacterium]